MQIDPQALLPALERAGEVVFWDLETTGREADYHSILCSTVKPYGKKAHSFTVVKPGDDEIVTAQTLDALSKYLVWVTYYGKGFDIKFLKTRAMKWGLGSPPSRHHLDLYWACKGHLLTGRRSQAHLLEWLDTKHKKMTVSPDMWNQVLSDPVKNMPVIQKRCESDCSGLENLYDEVKYIVRDITK